MVVYTPLQVLFTTLPSTEVAEQGQFHFTHSKTIFVILPSGSPRTKRADNAVMIFSQQFSIPPVLLKKGQFVDAPANLHDVQSLDIRTFRPIVRLHVSARRGEMLFSHTRNIQKGLYVCDVRKH